MTMSAATACLSPISGATIFAAGEKWRKMEKMDENGRTGS
jgi:hypothetical protein